jgi:hypothetical protein
MVAAADRAGVATAELPAVRARLTGQAQHLSEWATRVGASPPQLAPTPSEIAQAGPTLGDLSDGAAAAAVRAMGSTLDAVDAALHPAAGLPAVDNPTGSVHTAGTAPVPSAPVASATGSMATPPGPVAYGHIPSDDQPTQRPQWHPSSGTVTPPATDQPAVPSTSGSWLTRSVYLRNAAIYAGYASVVFSVQVVLFLLLDETRLPAAAPACLLVLPALSWAAGYLTIGAIFQAPAHGTLDRTPRLGVLVSLVPNGLLCAVLGLLFVADTVA